MNFFWKKPCSSIISSTIMLKFHWEIEEWDGWRGRQIGYWTDDKHWNAAPWQHLIMTLAGWAQIFAITFSNTCDLTVQPGQWVRHLQDTGLAAHHLLIWISLRSGIYRVTNTAFYTAPFYQLWSCKPLWLCKFCYCSISFLSSIQFNKQNIPNLCLTGRSNQGTSQSSLQD